MTVLLYFLNVACSAGQSTLSKHYASNGIFSLVQKQHQLLWPGNFRTESMLFAMLWGSVLLAGIAAIILLNL